MSETAAAKNTDRELWREREGDYYAPSLFVTEGGGIGVDVGGNIIVMPIRSWHKLADALQFYGDKANYKQTYIASKGFSVSETLCDGGLRARIALGLAE